MPKLMLSALSHKPPNVIGRGGDNSWLNQALCSLTYSPARIAQTVGHLTRKSEVPCSIPSLATYIVHFVSPSADSRRAVVHKVLVNRLGGLSLPRKSVVRLTDRPDMTLDVCRGHKTTTQQLTYSARWSTFETSNHLSALYIVVVELVLLFYIHSKQLWLCQDCQLTNM